MKSVFQESMLEKDEKVIMVSRPHLIITAFKMAPFVILSFLPLIIPDVLAWVSPVGNPFERLLPELDPDAARLLLGLWWLFLWMGAFRVLTAHYLDVWILTNRRLIDIEQYRFFSRQVSSVFLQHVQDATTIIHGVLPTVLEFGDIEIQTSGAANRFFIKGIPNPRHLRDTILSETQKVNRLV